MNHFLLFAARLQDAGVTQLQVTLDTGPDRTRLMRVQPAPGSPNDACARFKVRTFDLCGTDRVLEKLTDDLAYMPGGPTPEALLAAIKAHPDLRLDLAQWFADWALARKHAPTDDDLAAADATISDADARRMGQRIVDMLRGIDIARHRDLRTIKAADDDATAPGA